jgi:hypothetical protein
MRIDLLSGSGLFQSGSKLNIDLANDSGLSLVSSELALGFAQGLDVGSVSGISGSSHSHSIISSSNPGAGSSILATDSAGGITLQKARIENLGLGVGAPTGEQLVSAYSNNTDITVGQSQFSLDYRTTQLTAGNFNANAISIARYPLGGSDISNGWTQAALALGTHVLSAYNGILSNFSGINLYQNIQGNSSGSISNYIGLSSQLANSGSNTLKIYNNFGLWVGSPSSGGSILNNYGLYIGDQTAGINGNYSIYTGAGNVRFGGRTYITSSGCQLTLTGTDSANDYVNFLVDSNGYLNLLASGNQIRLNSATRIQSDTYTSQISGWGITHGGAADFRYVYADEMHVKSFIADLEQALAGGQIIAKSVAVLYQDFILPAAGNSGSLYVQDLPGASGMQVFQTNDIVGLRQFDRSGGSLTVAWGWGTVTNPSTSGSISGYQTWTFTRESGSPGYGSGTIQADSLVLDFGTSGNGYYEVNAIDGIYAENSPYSQIVTWDTSPSNRTVRVRTGNLKGITATSNEYGMFAGSGSLITNQYLRISNTNFDIHNLDLVIHDGTVERIRLDHEDGMYLSDENYKAVLGVYSGSTSKPWGGLTLETGDLLIGNLDVGAGIYWDKSLSRISVGGSDINIKMSGSSINFFNGATETASLTGSVWILGSVATENFQVTSTALQFRDGTTVYTDLSSGALTLGRVGSGSSNTLISAGNLSIRNNTTERIGLSSAGILTIKNSSGNAVFTFDSSAGAEFTLPLTLGTSGGIYQGSGTFASPTTGLKLYNVSGSGRFVGYSSGASQVALHTDGKLYAGGGVVVLDNNGIRIDATSASSTNRSYKFTSGGSVVHSSLNSYYDSSIHELSLLAHNITNHSSYINILADVDTVGHDAQITISSQTSANSVNFQILAGSVSEIVASGSFRTTYNANIGRGLEVGAPSGVPPTIGMIFAADDIRTAGGLRVGDTTTAVANGSINASGSISVGTVLFAGGDIRTAGGLRVGDTTTDVANGSINISGCAIMGGTVIDSESFGCSVYRSSNIAVSSGSNYYVVFNATYRDQYNWNSGTLSRITAPVDGMYIVTANLSWGANGSGIRAGAIQINRTTMVANSVSMVNNASVATTMSLSGACYMTAGQYVELLSYQDCGGSLSILAGSTLAMVHVV